VNACLAEGVAVRIFDPEAMANARQVWGDDIYYATDSYDAAHGADAVIVMTEWNMFRDMNLEKLKSVMKGSLFLDFRNLYTMDELTIAGFEGYVLGRGSGIPFDKAIDSILE
jgi:UDPglucose 6-dehydrogenase